MKTFIRSYTDIRGLRKGTVYEVADFGNKILIPYYNKDEKPVPMTSVCFTRLMQDKFLVEVQPMRKEGTSIRNLVCAPPGTGQHLVRLGKRKTVGYYVRRYASPTSHLYSSKLLPGQPSYWSG